MIDFNVYNEQKPEVFLTVCPGCGTKYYPAPMICKKCFERRDPADVIYSEWEKVPLEGKCKLLTWTRVYALPEGFDIQYLLFGIVEFEDGIRASVRLEVDKPEIGMELEARADIINERKGEDIYGLFAYPVT